MNHKLCLSLSVAALLCMAQPQISPATVYEVNATGKTEAAAEGNSRMNALRQCLNGMLTPEQAKEHAMDLRPLFRKLNSLTSVEVLESGQQNNLVTLRANVTVDEEALRAELKAIPALAALVQDPEQQILPTPDIQQPVPGGGEIAQNNGSAPPAPDVPSVDISVENAIANALAAAHAKAEKVTFSAEEQSLVITGLEYTGPQGNIQHKGRIEQIRLEGFDEKALLESGDEPGELPRLAEKAVISGWTDFSEENGDKMVLSMETSTVQGWYQRLGTLLKSASQEDKGVFFSELVNYRLDGAQAENLTIRLEPSKPDSLPVNITVKSLEEPGGVPAPGTDGQPRKANQVMSGIAFASGEASGTLDKITLSGVIIPQPAQMAALWKKISDTGKKADPETALKMLADIYGGNPPFSLVSFENLKVETTEKGALATLDNLSLAMDGSDDGAYKLDFSINALRLTPSAMGKFKEMAMRHAPEGVVLDMRVNGSSAETGSNANASIKLREFGSLEFGWTVKGDGLALLKQLPSLAKDSAGLNKLLSDNVTSTKLVYEDSGLLPLVANLALGCNDAIGLDGLNLALRYDKDQELKANFVTKGLRVGLELLEQYRAEIARFAPDGIIADISLDHAITKEGYTGNSSLVARGLGKLDTNLALRGDILAFLAKTVEDNKSDELMQMLSQIKLASMNSAYEDSGLAAMLLGIFAKQAKTEPANLLPALTAQAESWASSGNAFYAKLGGMLKEQLANPGTMSIRLAPGTDIDVMTFGMMAAGSPDKLPLEFSSEPGSKSMEEYLKK